MCIRSGGLGHIPHMPTPVTRDFSLACDMRVFIRLVQSGESLRLLVLTALAG